MALLELEDLLARHGPFVSKLLLQQRSLLGILDLRYPLFPFLLLVLLFCQQLEQLVVEPLSDFIQFVAGASSRLQRVALVGLNFGLGFNLA